MLKEFIFCELSTPLLNQHNVLLYTTIYGNILYSLLLLLLFHNFALSYTYYIIWMYFGQLPGIKRVLMKHSNINQQGISHLKHENSPTQLCPCSVNFMLKYFATVKLKFVKLHG